MRYACLLTFAVLALSENAFAQDAFDRMKSHPEDDLGIERSEADIMTADPAAREQLVNFTMTGTVNSIDDGDTIDIIGKGKARFVIRFSDMDTPEVSHKPYIDKDCPCDGSPFRPGQPGGRPATEALQSLVSVGDEVRVECYEPDMYGRFACHVFKGTQNLNLEQIKSGWGWLPSNAAWVRDPESRKAEDEAKAAKRGAWGLPGQISPNDWRRQCWDAGNCAGAENWPDGP